MSVRWYGRQVFEQYTQQNLNAMTDACYIVEAYIKNSFTLKGTGRKYRRTKQKGIYHYASLPGQPPAIDTGNLRASITNEIKKIEGNKIQGRVGPDIDYLASHCAAGTDIEYGLYLELGTFKMLPRPYLRPAIIALKNQILNIFKRANK